MKGLKTALQTYSKKTISDVKYGVETTRDIQYNESRRRIAVDTGATRDDIKKTPVRERGSAFQADVSMTSMIGVYLEYGTGIHAVPEGGGSRAKQIPWTYYNERDGKFYTTYGMRAQPFWFPSLDITRQYFKNYFSN